MLGINVESMKKIVVKEVTVRVSEIARTFEWRLKTVESTAARADAGASNKVEQLLLIPQRKGSASYSRRRSKNKQHPTVMILQRIERQES